MLTVYLGIWPEKIQKLPFFKNEGNEHPLQVRWVLYFLLNLNCRWLNFFSYFNFSVLSESKRYWLSPQKILVKSTNQTLQKVSLQTKDLSHLGNSCLWPTEGLLIISRAQQKISSSIGILFNFWSRRLV